MSDIKFENNLNYGLINKEKLLHSYLQMHKP